MHRNRALGTLAILCGLLCAASVAAETEPAARRGSKITAATQKQTYEVSLPEGWDKYISVGRFTIVSQPFYSPRSASDGTWPQVMCYWSLKNLSADPLYLGVNYSSRFLDGMGGTGLSAGYLLRPHESRQICDLVPVISATKPVNLRIRFCELRFPKQQFLLDDWHCGLTIGNLVVSTSVPGDFRVANEDKNCPRVTEVRPVRSEKGECVLDVSIDNPREKDAQLVIQTSVSDPSTRDPSRSPGFVAQKETVVKSGQTAVVQVPYTIPVDLGEKPLLTYRVTQVSELVAGDTAAIGLTEEDLEYLSQGDNVLSAGSIDLLSAAKKGQVSLPEYLRVPATELAGSVHQVEGFSAPANTPRAHYTIDCRVDPTEGVFNGNETIRLKNSSTRAVTRIVFAWIAGDGSSLKVSVAGRQLAPIGSQKRNDMKDNWPAGSPLVDVVFDLPQALAPGATQEIAVMFGARTSPVADGEVKTLTYWHPQLYWGFDTHDDFDVKLDIPPDCVVVTSGRLDNKSGRYHAENTRLFGLAFGRGLKLYQAFAGDVLVQALHTAKGAECARLVLATAVDAIDFYKKRFGFYPYSVLSMIPGMDRAAGGCPLATSIVMIHGEERLHDRDAVHWQRITAHEIGHQYWSEWVIGKDLPTWFSLNCLDSLMIGLGIYADKEYCRVRGVNFDYAGYFRDYADAVREGQDTTVAMSGEQLLSVNGEFHNQIVVHAKGYCIISTLANVLGHQAFDRVYRNCLKDFRGRRMGLAEFQAECERESGQELSWFFDQWVRSNAFPAYEVSSKSTSKVGDRYLTKVEVKCLGTLKMPVPVAAVFEDGSRQVQKTDRLLNVNTLRFESRLPLKDVVLDPDGELALVGPPFPSNKADISKRIRGMAWTGDDEKSLDLFAEAKAAQLAEADAWFKLGMVLYDGKHYPEALQAFGQVTSLSKSQPILRFAAYCWQGHLLDLTGHRDDALSAYQQALKIDIGGQKMQHDQYGMIIDRKWVEDRLKIPFERK